MLAVGVTENVPQQQGTENKNKYNEGFLRLDTNGLLWSRFKRLKLEWKLEGRSESLQLEEYSAF